MPEAVVQSSMRPLMASDNGALNAIYATSTGPSLDFLMRLYRQPTTRAWIQESASVTLGAAWFSVYDASAELIDLSISPAYRRQGWGMKLLQTSLDLLESESVSICHLEVRRSNCAAIALYQRTNFRIVGERANYYRSQDGREDAILMRRESSGYGECL
jgi:ribosomal-protein-alanine N-acetyltransferase